MPQSRVKQSLAGRNLRIVILSEEGRAQSALPRSRRTTCPLLSPESWRGVLGTIRVGCANSSTSRGNCSDVRGPWAAYLPRVHRGKSFAQDDRLLGTMQSRRHYTFASLCISTVLHVLSPARQISSSGHSAHLGLRARQRLRPCQMIWCENKIHFSRGITFIKSCSIFCGSFCFVNSSRREMRCTCVSTTTPSAILNHEPSTTFAVLRATPGRVSSLSISHGTCPPKSETIFL